MTTMKNLSNEEKEKVFKANENLIHHVLKKYKKQNLIEYDDMYQICAIEFFDAMKTYDDDKNKNFANYVCVLMKHKINSELKALSRIKRNCQNDISLNNNTTSDYDTVEFIDLIEDKSCKNISNSLMIKNIMNFVKENCSERTYSIFISYIVGHKVGDIAKKYGLTKQRVSAIIKETQLKVSRFRSEISF